VEIEHHVESTLVSRKMDRKSQEIFAAILMAGARAALTMQRNLVSSGMTGSAILV
jgi:hypothetical protein